MFSNIAVSVFHNYQYSEKENVLCRQQETTASNPIACLSPLLTNSFSANAMYVTLPNNALMQDMRFKSY